jgi:hypothetical protein
MSRCHDVSYVADFLVISPLALLAVSLLLLLSTVGVQEAADRRNAAAESIAKDSERRLEEAIKKRDAVLAEKRAAALRLGAERCGGHRPSNASAAEPACLALSV